MKVLYQVQIIFAFLLFATIWASSSAHRCTDVYNWRCFSEEFGCIRPSDYCDGKITCDDGSDEESCPHQECLGEWIKRCKDSKRCIWVGFHCSGYDRCQDGTIDNDCTSCRMDGYLCPNSTRCARPEKKCTGYDVCYDGSSDENCSSCKESGFLCKNNRCIRPERLCNGRDECGDGGSSNLNCTVCFGGAVKCPGNPRRCARTQDYCTGFNVCGDGSTDQGCKACTVGATLYAKTERCVRTELFCTGRNESGDGESDLDCKVCHGHAFHCNNKRCIPSGDTCNGIDVCGDGSSNSNCTVCKGSAVLCPNEPKCISQDKICNGHWDCAEGIDERMFCTNSLPHQQARELGLPIYVTFLTVLVLIIIGLCVWYFRYYPNAQFLPWRLK